jgi:hypothetical protein
MANWPARQARFAGMLAIIIGMAVGARAETMPPTTIQTKTAAISVTIDPMLSRYPALAENLLAEARNWAKRNQNDAAKSAKTEPMAFRDGQPWTFSRSYRFLSEVGRFVSVLRTDESFTGGAHPNSSVDTVLWDRDSRRRTSIRALFRETADNGPTLIALAQLARIAVAADKLSRGIVPPGVEKEGLTPERLAVLDTFIADGIQPSLLRLKRDAFSLVHILNF